MSGIWKEIESGSALNTGIAAAVSEVIVATPTNVQNFNRLEVTNRDAVACRVKLDSGDAVVGGKVYDIPANAVLTINPWEGITFKQVVQTNLHASTAETAGTILFRWAKAIRVG